VKLVYALFIGFIVLSMSGIAQADDPYSGTYSCSGQPQEGCGQCTDIEIYPPNGVVVSQAGATYQICPTYDDPSKLRGDQDCVNIAIVDGVAHWSGTTTGEGITFTGQATATFSGNTIRASETGQVSGICNCNVSLSATCTK